MTNILAKRLGSYTKLTPTDVELLARILGTALPLSPGNKLPAVGSRSTAIHLLLEGWAFRYKLVKDGRRQIVALLLPGETFEPYELEDSRMDYAIGLLDGAVAVRIDPDELSAAAAQSTSVKRAMRGSNAAESAILRQWLVNVGRRNAFERLAHLFCELWTRAVQVDLASRDELELPLTQEHLGDALALTAVHVNRVLRRMREDGLISLRGGRLKILDMPALRAAAAFDAGYLGFELAG